MDRPTKKRRIDPFDAFSIADPPPRRVGGPDAQRSANQGKSKFSLALPPGFLPSSAAQNDDRHTQRSNAQAGPSKPSVKPVVKAPLYGLPGLAGFGSPSSHGSITNPCKPGQATSTPSKPLATLSSASPFPFPSHMAPNHQRGPTQKSSSFTPLRPMSNLRPESPFASGRKPGDDDTPDRKPMKSLLELRPIVRGKGAVDEIEDSDDEEGFEMDVIEGCEDKMNRSKAVEESPSKPGPAVRNGEMSLAARLSGLIVRQEASLSLFQTNLRLSAMSKSTSTGLRNPTSKMSTTPSQQRARPLDTLMNVGQVSTMSPAAETRSSILESADVVLNVLEVLLPVQHGCPLFRARINRSDEMIKKAMLNTDTPAGPGDSTTPSTNIAENPFLETASRNSSARRQSDSSTRQTDGILVTFLPLNAAAASTKAASRALGLDPRGLADGMRAFQAAGLASGGSSQKRTVEVGIWKPFHLVELEQAECAGDSRAKDGSGTVDGLSGERSSARLVIMCSRYVILEVA